MELTDKKEMERKISKELIELNIPLEQKSFIYWKYLLMYVYENQLEDFNIMDLYEITAKKFNNDPRNIEKNLRTGFLKMKSKIAERYNFNNKIYIPTLIRLFQIYVF